MLFLIDFCKMRNLNPKANLHPILNKIHSKQNQLIELYSYKLNANRSLTPFLN